MTATITVVLIEDQPVVRSGLGAWLERADPPLQVVAEGDTVDVAFSPAGRSADVVILDLRLRQVDPHLAGLARLREARRRVVIFTETNDPTTASRCIRHGARAYVTKEEHQAHLVKAVHEAAAGTTYISPSLSRGILADERRPQLSDQQLAALRALAACETRELAAQAIGVTLRTLNSHLGRVSLKYMAAGRPATTRMALVKRALQDGLIEIEDLEGETWEM